MATYYEILEVDRHASKQDIKTAFKKLAVKYHPDHNPGDISSEEYFKQINEAYQVLSDEVKKQNYDLGLELLYTNPYRPSPNHNYQTTYQRPVYNTSYEPYTNTYDPKNYVSKSLQLKIKIFAGLFMVLMCVIGFFTYKYMAQYTAKGHYEEALEFFEKQKYRAALVKIGYALEFNQDHKEAHLLRAKINSEIYHNYIMALDDFDFIINHTKKPSSELFYKKGKCYFNLYDFENAIVEFEKSIKESNPKGEYYYFLALAKIKSEKKYADVCQNLDAAKKAGYTNFEDIDQDYCP